MNIISIFLILGAMQGIILSLFLLTNRSEARIANRYLAVLVLLCSAPLLTVDLFLEEFLDDDLTFQLIIWPKEFLYGPILYFYVRELIFPRRYLLFQKRQWLHFLPALFHIIIVWSLLLLERSHLENLLIHGGDTIFELIWTFLINDFEDIMGVIHVGIYLFLSLRLLRRHQNFLQQNYSYLDKINLSWLRFIVLSLCVLWVAWIISIIAHTDELFILEVGLVLLIYLMGYAGLKHPVVYNQMAIHELPSSTNQRETSVSVVLPTTDKYQNSALSSDQCEMLLEELEQLMHTRKPYLDSKLSLPKLAESLSLSANYLSQIINEQKQQNFFDFVNSYRIEEAKHRLLNPQQDNEKIVTIAMDVGFNSKSSFYTAFRKTTGLTPSQYRASAN